jgi:hypothetical protein
MIFESKALALSSPENLQKLVSQSIRNSQYDIVWVLKEDYQFILTSEQESSISNKKLSLLRRFLKIYQEFDDFVPTYPKKMLLDRYYEIKNSGSKDSEMFEMLEKSYCYHMSVPELIASLTNPPESCVEAISQSPIFEPKIFKIIQDFYR